MNDCTKFQKLLRLLIKIEKSNKHVRLEIDFDGKEFKWRMSIGGLSAEEWSPSAQFPPREMAE